MGALLLLFKPLCRVTQPGGPAALAALAFVTAGWRLFSLRGAYLSFLGGALLADSLSFYFQVLLLVTGLLTLGGTVGWARRNPGAAATFLALLLWETAVLLLLVSAGELTALYLAFGASLALSLALVRLPPVTDLSREAALKFVLLAGLAGALLLYGMGFLYGLAGTTNLEEIGVRLGASGESPLLLLSLFLLFAGFGFLLAAAPFHFWVPDVCAAAPLPAAAYLAVAPKVAGLAVLLRVVTTALPAQIEAWSTLAAAAAAGALVFGSLVALPQANLRRLLAHLGVAQAGCLLLGVAALSPEGLTAVLFQAALYAFFSLAAFVALAAWEELTGRSDLESFRGAARRAPLPALALVLALLALGGVPPVGFFGKFVLYLAGVHQRRTALVFVAALTSVVSVYPALRLFWVAYAEPVADWVPAAALVPKPGTPATGDRVAPTTLLATALTLLGTLSLGVHPGWLLQVAGWAARLFWG